MISFCRHFSCCHVKPQKLSSINKQTINYVPPYKYRQKPVSIFSDWSDCQLRYSSDYFLQNSVKIGVPLLKASIFQGAFSLQLIQPVSILHKHFWEKKTHKSISFYRFVHIILNKQSNWDGNSKSISLFVCLHENVKWTLLYDCL